MSGDDDDQIGRGHGATTTETFIAEAHQIGALLNPAPAEAEERYRAGVVGKPTLYKLAAKLG